MKSLSRSTGALRLDPFDLFPEPMFQRFLGLGLIVLEFEIFNCFAGGVQCDVMTGNSRFAKFGGNEIDQVTRLARICM